MYKTNYNIHILICFILSLASEPFYSQTSVDTQWVETGKLPNKFPLNRLKIHAGNVLIATVSENTKEYLYYSLDMGRTWQKNSMPDIDFNGFAELLSDGNKIILTQQQSRAGVIRSNYITENLGKSWDALQDKYENQNVVYINSSIAYLPFRNEPFLLKKNGNSWEKFDVDQFNDQSSLSFVPAGSDNVIPATAYNIELTNVPFPHYFNIISSEDFSRIYCLSATLISTRDLFVTIDKGKTWNVVYKNPDYVSPGSLTCRRIFRVCKPNIIFGNFTRGFRNAEGLLKEQDDFCYSTNGGKAWESLGLPGGRKVTQLFYVNDGSILVLNENNTFFQNSTLWGCANLTKDTSTPCDKIPANQNLVNLWKDEGRKYLLKDVSPEIRNQPITCAYAKMYLTDPAHFKWAGLAAIVSGKVGESQNDFHWGVGVELKEDVFKGNRAVFDDLFWQHLAFQKGGIKEMERLYCSKAISDEVYFAWQKIAQGDVWKGNQMLLFHEQSNILQNIIYANHSYLWWTVDSWAGIVVRLGNVLTSPVPGNPNVFPSGKNIANFDDRWKWIEDEILPSWKNFETNKNNEVLLIQALQEACPSINQAGNVVSVKQATEIKTIDNTPTTTENRQIALTPVGIQNGNLDKNEGWICTNGTANFSNGVVTLETKKNKVPMFFESNEFQIQNNVSELILMVDKSQVVNAILKVSFLKEGQEEIIYDEKINNSLDMTLEVLDALTETEETATMPDNESDTHKFESIKIDIKRFRNKNVKLKIIFETRGLLSSELFIDEIKIK